VPKKFILFVSSVFTFLIASGQEGLLIKNTKTGVVWMYEKNARVTYIKFHEDEYKTGILNALLDSSVVFGKDTVLLKDIAGIRKKGTLHKMARVVGMPLMLIGSLLMGNGAASIYSNPDSDVGIKLFLTGAAIFTLGYMPYEISMEDLTVGIGGEWTIQISRK
jgi:hypothetical protein